MKTARRFDLIARLACVLAACLLLAACAAPAGNAGAPGAAITSAPATDAMTAPADIAAAITSPAPATTTSAAVATVVDLSCKTDTDCAVKDVGSCCGYHPQCVNTNSTTFPDQVKAACAAENRAGVCGFPSIAGCHCLSGSCAATEGTAADRNLK